MLNNKYGAKVVKKRCEQKFNIDFTCNKECNGWYIHNDKKIARITIPKSKGGKKGIATGTYKSMAAQLKLSISQFELFLECPFKEEHYIKHLIDAGHIVDTTEDT